MRYSPDAGVVVKQLSTEVPTADHKLVQFHAKKKGMSVQDLLRSWLKPHIAQIKSDHEMNTD